MGVMSCSRSYCNSIMCDTYVHDVGYVCHDCQAEFKKYLQLQGLNPQTDTEISQALKAFMETEKDSFKEGTEMTVDAFFNQRTN